MKLLRKKSSASNPFFEQKVAKFNVLLILKQIPEQSPIVAELIENGKVIVGAMYNVEKGLVEFFADEGLRGNNFARKIEASADDQWTQLNDAAIAAKG